MAQRRTFSHRIFDLAIAADFAIPELPPASATVADVEVSRYPAEYRMQTDVDWFDQWPRDAEPAEWRLGRWPNGYLLDYPNYAEFGVSHAGARIEYCPAPGCDDKELRRLLIDQVLPRVMSHRGVLTLHAAAVRVADSVLCFMAPSGFGKSTLAAAYAAAGARLLCDDAVSVRCRDGVISCIGAYQGIRLWPDSAPLSAGLDYRQSSVSARTAKRRCLPRMPKGPDRTSPLAAILLLDELSAVHRGPVRMVSGSAVESMAYLTAQCFKMDVRDPKHLSLLLQQMACVVERVPVYRLEYPRRFEMLPRVIEYLQHRLRLPPLTMDALR